MHKHGVFLTVLRLDVVAVNYGGISCRSVRNGLELNKVDLCLRVAVRGDLRK